MYKPCILGLPGKFERILTRQHKYFFSKNHTVNYKTDLNLFKFKAFLQMSFKTENFVEVELSQEAELVKHILLIHQNLLQ